MLNEGNLSFLATVSKSAEGAARVGALSCPSAHGPARPPNSRARAEQLLRARLLQARERGSRWHQKRKQKSPKVVRPPSANLHRAYREPMPPPPPNSPRYNLLGLPTPLLGVPYINPRSMIASPSPPATAEGGQRGDSEGQDFDSDGFRDLDSCAENEGCSDSGSAIGSRRKARSPRKLSRAASRRGQEAAAGAADKKYSFFDVFYSAVKQEVERRSAFNLADLASMTAEGKSSPKKRVKFRERACTPDEHCRLENEGLHSGLESIPVLSPNPVCMARDNDESEVKMRAAFNLADLASMTAEAKSSPKKRVRFRETACTPDEHCRLENEDLHSGLENIRVLSPNPVCMARDNDGGEVKMRVAFNLADLASMTAEEKSSPKKRVRFRETACTPDEHCRFENEGLHSGLENIRVLSPNPVCMDKANDRGDVKFDNYTWETPNLQNSKNESHPESDKVHSLPPLVVKKDKVITSSLRSSSTHEPFSDSLEKRDNYLRVTQSTYQKSDQKNKTKNFNSPSFLAKRHELGTEKIIEKLTEGGIHYSTLFDIGKIKGSKTPDVYTPLCMNTNKSSRLFNIDNDEYDAFEMASASRLKENASEEQNEPPFSAAHRLYLSAKSSIERSRRNVGEKFENKGEVQKNRNNIYRPKESSQINNDHDIWAKKIYKDADYTYTGLNDVAKQKLTVNIEDVIARNEALAKEIDESLARALSQGNSSLDQITSTTDVANHITLQDNTLSDAKTYGLNSENVCIANKKVGSMEVRNQKPADQDAVFGLIKEMVKLKRARNLSSVHLNFKNVN